MLDYQLFQKIWHKDVSTSSGTLFPVTFRMVLTSLATSYSTLPYQMVKRQQSLTAMLAFCMCGQESGGPYSFWVANSLFRLNQTYSFRVAARNSHGDGSFSDPVSVESVPILISQGIVANNHSCCYIIN